MQLVSARCPDCGAELKIPEGSLNVTCEYCGSNILVSEILGSNSVIQNCMTLAFTALKGENFKDAYDNFNKALELDSSNYNAWFGKAVCTGMMSRIADCRYDEMIALFENAIKNAPADKQANIKKNAAAEVVKAIRNSANKFQIADQLFMSVSRGGFSSVIGGFAGGLQNMMSEVTRALQKAHEYDPNNTDVTTLMNEIATGAHFNTGGGFVQTSQQIFASPVSQPPVTGPVYGRKKGGCVAVAASLIMIVGIGIVIYLVSITKDKTSVNKTTPPTYYSSYTYSVVKVTESKGKLYIALSTDAVDDSNLVTINNGFVRKYAEQNKPVIINYYSIKSFAERNDAVQLSRSKDWILKNAASINLKETSEYDPEDYSITFYRYVNGKTKQIETENDKSLQPKPPK